MPKGSYMKSTFSFNKLANKLESIIINDLNVVGSRLNKAIQDGIDQGKDIKGNSFKPLEPITIALGGKKPLNRTGNMRKTKKTPAKKGNPQFIIEMAGKSRKGAYYGAYHNTGFTQTNPKQWFHGSEVKKREWFGVSKSMLPGESEYNKAIKERTFRIRSAWKKRG